MSKARTLQCTNENESQFVHSRVDRRKVLKLAAIGAGVALSSLFLPLYSDAATENPVKLKGTSTGKIYISRDDGKTWKFATDFGVECPVLSIRSTSAGYCADIGHKGNRFTLRSVDGLRWKG